MHEHTHTYTAELRQNGSKKKHQMKTEAKEMLEKGHVSVCSMALNARKSRLQSDSEKSVFPSNLV